MIRQFNMKHNWGLWKYSDNVEDCFFSLYNHNSQEYFSLVFRFSKGNFADVPRGTYVLIGKYYIVEKSWKEGNYSGWTPIVVRYHVNGYYQFDKPGSLAAAYPINKASTFDLIHYAKRVEELNSPTNENDESRNWFEQVLYRLSCEEDPNPEQNSIVRFPEAEFLSLDDTTYGSRILKKCYLNPFEFERKHPELIKKRKRWLLF